MWATVDFVPAHLQSAIPFWRGVILPATIEADRDTLLGWIRGVSVHDFIDSRAQGTFQGHQYSGPDLTSVHLPNHVSSEYCSWVTAEVEQLVRTGCIARWADVADTSLYTKPNMVLPLGVEPKKPRLIWDARWHNLICVRSPLYDGWHGESSSVRVARGSPGYNRSQVGLSSCSARTIIMAVLWIRMGRRILRVHGPMFWLVFRTVHLCFSFRSGGPIFALPRRSGTDLDRRFLRDQFRSTRLLEPNQQFVAAQAAASLVLDVLYQAGYFISISKCELTPSTRLVFLGIIYDTVQCRFEAPADKLEKLEHMLSDAVTSGAITFQMLEKLAGKCTSLSVAVPVAALYTHHMYKQIASFQRTWGRYRSTVISIPKNSGLMFEMERWLEVRKAFNDASWYRAEHIMVILTCASDASSSGWGGLIRGLHHDVFRAGGDFPPALAEEHINVQEGYALQQTLRLFCADHPDDVAGATLVSDVDNKVLHDAFKRGRARNTLMHDTIIALFWLQVRHDFTLKLRWVSSAANADADGMSRPGPDDYVRLDDRMFGELCEWAGDFDMDLMATPASVHKTWVGGTVRGQTYPFILVIAPKVVQG